jgi:hypothetical protein
MHRWPLPIVLACVACATATSKPKPMSDRFTPMAKSFTAAPSVVQPLLVIDNEELDSIEPFKSVGILEVQGHEKESLNGFLARVREAGGQLGCDVVLQRDAYRLGTRVQRWPTLGGVGWGPEWITNDQAVWQFICGVFNGNVDEAWDSREAANKLAAKLREEELGAQICVPYTPTGSHIMKMRVCANDPQQRRDAHARNP